MDQEQEKAENYISERLAELLSKLTKDQLRFVVAMQEHNTKKDAAEALDLSPQIVYRWNGEVDEAIKLMAADALEAARQIRRKALVKAIAVKIGGLDSDNETIRQKAASELIDWEMGKAGGTLDITSGGEKLQHDDERINRAISTLADALGKALPGEGNRESG